MACPKCGCRMVTKVGPRSEGRLICADCGRPVDSARLGQDQRRRWQGALLVTLLAFAGGLLFLLASADEEVNGGGPGVEEPAGGKGEAGDE